MSIELGVGITGLVFGFIALVLFLVMNKDSYFPASDPSSADKKSKLKIASISLATFGGLLLLVASALAAKKKFSNGNSDE
jgi:hypothetical protein